MKVILEINGDNKEIMNDVKVLIEKYKNNLMIHDNVNSLLVDSLIDDRLKEIGYNEDIDEEIKEVAIDALSEYLEDYPQKAFNYKGMNEAIKEGIDCFIED